MSIFNEYLQGEERVLAIENATFENEFNKLDTMYEMCNLQLSQMYRDAELKVLTESGTYDDLTFLIQEADEAVSDKKKGILSTIFDGIIKFFKTIGEKLRSLLGIGDNNQIVEANSATVENGKKLKKVISDATSACDKLKVGDVSGLTILKGLGISSIVIGGGVGGAVVVKKYRAGELKGLSESISKGFDGLTNKFESMRNWVTNLFKRGDKPEEQQSDNANDESKDETDTTKESFNIIRAIGKKVSEFADWVKGLFHKDKPAEGENKPEENNGENKTDDGNTEGENKPEENNGGTPEGGNKYPTNVPKPNGNDNYSYAKLSNGVVYRKEKKTGKIAVLSEVIQNGKNGGKTTNKYTKVANPSDEVLNAKFESAEALGLNGMEVIEYVFSDVLGDYVPCMESVNDNYGYKAEFVSLFDRL